ncbi:MAG TPA: pyridoxamine 5'-phosphate oxidase family protein [Nitrososphaeraceae archaeon]|jgi:hypothetical protein
MQLINKLEIKSKEKIKEFLNTQLVGRIASIDKNGYPQIIPMNFVYVSPDSTDEELRKVADKDCVYMHSHRFGEKLDNIRLNSRVGFEVDRHICFLPSYYFHPHDASQADTLYISVVIKGKAEIIEDGEEKAFALNKLMQKYQNRDRYQELDHLMPSVREVAVIRILPNEIRGKYKIGQQWKPAYRLKIAKSIISRENKHKAEEILNIMRIEVLSDGTFKIIEEPLM